MKKERRRHRRAQFSIGAKLVTIITVIVIMSLGAIIGLVSWLVRNDLQITAEAGNFEVNRRSATETEYTLITMRSMSRLLMQTVNSPGDSTQAVNYFFEQNPFVAAVIFTGSGQSDQLLTNRQFFKAKDIDTALAEAYRESSRSTLRRAAAGETTVLNASPLFNTSLLALFFPGRNGEGGCVVFSPENLNNSFGFGTNQTYIINSAGDVLVHGDFELAQLGSNIADQSFVRYIRESAQRSAQTLYQDDEGDKFFGAFTKLNIAGVVVITSIEYDKVFEGIDATTRRNIYLTFAVLCISIMLIWFFAKTISVPLKELAATANDIQGGKFEVDLHPKGNDELTTLTYSFQRMCSALNVFGRFTNKTIAVQAMRGEIKPGGFPKHATVFFSDIRSFTELSENFTKKFGDGASDRIVHWLNEYFTHMIQCVEKTGGIVDKFIGDAVMAHWGTAYTAGSPQKDAFNCVKAALMMRTALAKMNANRKIGDPANPPIRIGCGINTGVVTAGQIGSDLRMEYTVIGDAVNLASRTESLNKPLGTDILITEDTWALIKDHLIVEEMPPVTVKGKSKPVRMFAVVNLAAISSGPRTLADVRRLLGIKPPDISGVDVNAEEHKYKIAGGGAE